MDWSLKEHRVRTVSPEPLPPGDGMELRPVRLSDRPERNRAALRPIHDPPIGVELYAASPTHGSPASGSVATPDRPRPHASCRRHLSTAARCAQDSSKALVDGPPQSALRRR
jgi:hypothetical protein